MLPSEYVERGWCQGALAKDADGSRVGPTDPDACQWCAMGAIRAGHLTGSITEEQHVRIFNIINSVCDGLLGTWNDAPFRTQAEVVAMLREVEREVLGEVANG